MAGRRASLPETVARRAGSPLDRPPHTGT